MTIKVAIAGARGRMGTAAVKAINESATWKSLLHWIIKMKECIYKVKLK